jgi:hypothetical protein
MEFTSLSRFIGYCAATAGSFLVIVVLTMASWFYARPANGHAASRLRWHMITKNRIAKGTQIKTEDVTWTLGRVSTTDPLIPISKTVVGKYAKSDIEPNSSCVPNLLSDLALAEAPAGGVVIPMEVKTSDVSSLRPGMHLAFVQTDKSVEPKTTLLHGQTHPGLLLLSMTRSSKDAGVTTLLVEVGKDSVASVPLLVNGTWRPVILGEPVAPTVQATQLQPKQSRTRTPRQNR